MSRFARKSDEVVQQGALARGEFNPTGVPLKMYKYWERVTRSKIPQTENFCHFWRVVVLWAPLNFLGQQALGLFSKSATWYLVASLYALAFLVLSFTASAAFSAFLVIPYMLLGLITGTLAAKEGWPERDPNDQGLRLATWLALPVSGLLYGVSKIGAFVGRHPRIETALGIVAVSLMAISVTSIVGVLLFAGFSSLGLEFILWLIGAAVLIAVGALTLAYVFSVIDARIDAKRRLQDERREKWFNNELTDDEYFGRKPKREPGKIALFFKGVGEFIGLAWNIVRVKKWKICPIVNVPPETVSE